MARRAGALWPAHNPLQPFRALAGGRVWDRLLEAVSAAYDGDIIMIDSSCVRVLRAACADHQGVAQRRRNRRDNTRATLEAQLDSIIEELHGWIDYRRDQRLKDERNARLRRRAEENRKRTEARTKREEERDELLDEIVEMGRKAEQLRSWVAWAAEIEDTETQRMLNWARQRLGELERALDPTSFGDWLRERTLFPEVDPFAPLPADPDLETPPPQDSAA